MRSTRPIPARRSAFTVVELLVVIALIMLLIALLLPQFSKAREKGRQFNCLSNMRQLGIAVNAYQMDNGGFYPQPSEDSAYASAFGNVAAGKAVWFNAVDQYLIDPSKDYAKGNTGNRNYNPYKQDPVWESIPDSVTIGGTTYNNVQRDSRTIKMNEHFGDPGGGWTFWRDVDVASPGKTLMFVDGRAMDVRPDSANDGSYGWFHATESAVGLRHSDGANVDFADGHGEWVYEQVRYTTAAPSWFNEPDPLQIVTWEFQKL
jgi:prepilin-type processing-associated H-X9-DG protein